MQYAIAGALALGLGHRASEAEVRSRWLRARTRATGIGSATRCATTSSRSAPTTRRRGPTRGTGLWPTLKRAALEFREDNMTDWAAALTYYGLLSLFPALIALVSVLGLVRRSAGDDADDHRRGHPDRPELGRRHLRRPDPSRSPRTGRPSGILFVVGLAIALWSASGYIGAFMRASNIIWETPEGRGVLQAAPAAARGHPGDDRRARAGRAGARPHRPDRAGGRRRDRCRRYGADGLGYRQVAGAVRRPGR